MKKNLCIFALLFVLIAIAGCGSSAPPQKTEVNVTPPTVNVTPPTVNVTPPTAPKVEVNVTTPAPPTTPKK
ncbi:MAG: hypothetical protein AB9917_11775 [Negativicutes bacterium]